MNGEVGTDDDGEVVVDGSVEAEDDDVDDNMTVCLRGGASRCKREEDERGIGTPIAAGAPVVVIAAKGIGA